MLDYKKLWERAGELETTFEMIKSIVQNPIELTEEDIENFESNMQKYFMQLWNWKYVVVETIKNNNKSNN